jgi:NAD(P)-dependent dehydrogenase (short-subunit alcohol dehydrogenase family)
MPARSAVLDRFGRLDCFIGNAAIWDHGATLIGRSGEDLDKGFDELFAINVKGYLLGAKAAAQALIASEARSFSPCPIRPSIRAAAGRSTPRPNMRAWAWCANWPMNWRPRCASTPSPPAAWPAICAARRRLGQQDQASWIRDPRSHQRDPAAAILSRSR